MTDPFFVNVVGRPEQRQLAGLFIRLLQHQIHREGDVLQGCVYEDLSIEEQRAVRLVEEAIAKSRKASADE